MPNTGNSLASLAERMRAKTEQDRQELEALTRQQFNALSESLRQSSTAALRTTEAAIQEKLGKLEESIASRCQTLSWAFGKRWLQALLLSMALLMGTALGGWGVVTLITNRVLALQGEIQSLNASKAELENTVGQLEKRTWGLKLLENQDGRFIILPPKTSAHTGWTVGKQQAVKLE
ncbi:hypothetical protein DFW101_2322 [Solidesulfovibrio carbinoliphilus subsp. oakridgensis]|uniref:Mobilization protein n=1 Tax=Solidesulfovibrio carbinoliphilus subsp. oakridgensis TaxID=694327 RepID=G7QAY6_9BACT|nr:hypothetical protein [Solidesulfovibrio carbinoliphilus]EHJ48327.1 hypothetical protein DFW101_2322 [Solidesulfovibrio carbinoliphilus subsp. oakridgensis]